MLYRSTMKIATATILGLTALLGVSAHAFVNLDATGSAVGTVVFAKETIEGVTGTTYYNVDVDPTRDDLEIRVQVGFSITGSGTGSPVGVGFSLSGMQFRSDAALDVDDDVAIYSAAATVSGTLVPAEDITSDYTIEAAGITDETNFQFRVTVASGDTLARNATIRLDLGDKLALSATEPGRISVRIDPGQVSIFSGETVEDKRVTQTAARIVDAISVTATPALPVGVEVTSDFEEFAAPRTGEGEDRLLGTLNVTVNERALDAQSGLPLTFDNSALGMVGGLLNDSDVAGEESGKLTITFKNDINDFSFADFKLVPAGDDADGITGLGDVDCSAAGTDLVFMTPTGETEPNFEMGTVVDPNVRRSGLCIGIKTPAEPDADPLKIPDAMFTVDAVFDKSAERQFRPGGGVIGAQIGELRRNGATVQIPFLSENERHMQRLIIVNRSSQPVDYSMSFTPAAGAEVTPGNDATGTVPAEQEVILDVSPDLIIDIEGRDQTAATLTLVAAPTVVDVLTSTLTDNGASDTVNYDVK